MSSFFWDESLCQASNLGQIINDASIENGRPMKDYTVLSPARDPYRLDTPANHARGQWLALAYQQVNPEGRRLHLRGLHYALVGRVLLPDGSMYQNDDDTWNFLADKAAKAARWLGYLSWDALRDARNAPPQIFTPVYEEPRWYLNVGEVQVDIPEDLTPEFWLDGDVVRQPVRQVVIAEKQGVEDLLLPVCKRYGATLALPSGEISDSMVYGILKAANEDGRPLVIHQLGDFDPAGNQMAVSTSRTVQAMIDTCFPDLEVSIHAPALTRDQCKEWGLPSTPLKETEKRGDRWREIQGWEQTELDAAVAIAPGKFADVVKESLLQYYDTDVEDKSNRIEEELTHEANLYLAHQLGVEVLDRIRSEAEERLEQLYKQVKEVNDALHIDPYEVGIDMPLIPDVMYGDTARSTRPLFDSTEGFGVCSRRLIARKKLTGDQR